MRDLGVNREGFTLPSLCAFTALAVSRNRIANAPALREPRVRPPRPQEQIVCRGNRPNYSAINIYLFRLPPYLPPSCFPCDESGDPIRIGF